MEKEAGENPAFHPLRRLHQRTVYAQTNVNPQDQLHLTLYQQRKLEEWKQKMTKKLKDQWMSEPNTLEDPSMGASGATLAPPCSICPKSDREILKFISCYDQVQTGGRGQGGAVRWDSTAEMVSREEQ